MKKLLLIIAIVFATVLLVDAGSTSVTNDTVTFCDCETVGPNDSVIIDIYDDATGELENILILYEGMSYNHCETWAVINGIPSYPMTAWDDLCPL